LGTISPIHVVQTFARIFPDDEEIKRTAKKIRLIEWRGASPDHPILPSMPETKYLKFGIFQVID